jgi:tetratricopeptide (TPR) repeat protein
MRMPRLIVGLCVFLASGCAPEQIGLYKSLDRLGRKVSTGSTRAQRYFNQGFVLLWGFNHDEAVRAFEEAERWDPGCAMAWWGIAYALGPNINLALTDEAMAQRAYRAARKAKQLAAGATEVERALIDAINKRHAIPVPEDRKPLDEAYAKAMREVWKRFPEDPDVGVLFADSLLNLSKEWRQLRLDGKRGPHTPEAVATLEKVLARHPDHAGANHFYIHSVEASTRPERALVSARRLETLVPESGHLLHMPSHIYIRTGRYRDVIGANARAIQADDVFFAHAGPQGIYHFYRAHNYHFLVWAAMFEGAREQALSTAREMVARLPRQDFARLPRTIETFLYAPVHVMIRFGLWEDILAEPAPEASFSIALALWHQSRAIALANTARLDEALVEAEAFEKVAASVPKDKKLRGATADSILDLARQMMKGEVLFKQGRQKQAFVALRRAVEIEDSLPYAEPPGWMQPTRHALGALLLEAGEVQEAEAVYRADLDRHANNGWSLHGLAECLRRRGEAAEAARVDKRFRAAWKHADVKIAASCYCRTR